LRALPDAFLNSQLLKLRSKGDQNVNGKLVKLPDPDHPISIERNPSRVVAGRVIADTRNALTLREAAYSPVQYIPGDDVDFSQLERVDPPPGTLSRSGCGALQPRCRHE
jgi:hypothetical protein